MEKDYKSASSAPSLVHKIAQGASVYGVIAAFAGAISGLASRKPVGRAFFSGAINGSILGLGLLGTQELVQELRHSHPDDLINSALAGFGCGAVLGKLNGGLPQAWVFGAVLAVFSSSIHFANVEIREFRLRTLARTYISESEKQRDSGEVSSQNPEGFGRKSMNTLPLWQFPEWFPIRRYDPEESARRAREQEELFLQAVRAIKGEKAENDD